MRFLEDKFVAEVWAGAVRREVQRFSLIGPTNNPAPIKSINAGRDVIAAFQKIAASCNLLITFCDNSSTNVMEKGYWQQAGAKPAGAG